jgi:hypothetical protein
MWSLEKGRPSVGCWRRAVYAVRVHEVGTLAAVEAVHRVLGSSSLLERATL